MSSNHIFLSPSILHVSEINCVNLKFYAGLNDAKQLEQYFSSCTTAPLLSCTTAPLHMQDKYAMLFIYCYGGHKSNGRPKLIRKN